MDANQPLYSAVRTLVHAIRESHLLEVTKHLYVESRKGAVPQRHAFLKAYNHFWTRFEGFGELERQLCKVLHLQEILNKSIWTSVADKADLSEATIQELGRIYQRLVFVQSHLPALFEIEKLELSHAESVKMQLASELETEEKNDKTVLPPLRRRTDVQPPPGKVIYEQAFLGDMSKVPEAKLIARYLGGMRRIHDFCAEFVNRQIEPLEMVSVTDSPRLLIRFYIDEKLLPVLEQIHEGIVSSLPRYVVEVDEEVVEQICLQLPTLSALERLSELGAFTEVRAELMARRLRAGVELFMSCGALPQFMDEHQAEVYKEVCELCFKQFESELEDERSNQEAKVEKVVEEELAPISTPNRRSGMNRYLMAVKHFYGEDMSRSLTGRDTYEDEYFEEVEGRDLDATVPDENTISPNDIEQHDLMLDQSTERKSL